MIKLTFLIIFVAVLCYMYKVYRDYKNLNKARKSLSEEVVKGEILDVEAEIAKQKEQNNNKQKEQLNK